jgi:hypothetical protein
MAIEAARRLTLNKARVCITSFCDLVRYELDSSRRDSAYICCTLLRTCNSGESAMSEIVPREPKAGLVPGRLLLAIVAGCALFAAGAESFAYDGPTFRSGLWKFERTLETDGKPTDRLQTSGLSIDRSMTRCVNPTSALKAELTAKFAPFRVGACDTRDLQKTDSGYVFQKVCGGAAPVKTKVEVKSDSAYTEIHEGNVGSIPTREIVVAQRVGDCHPPM